MLRFPLARSPHDPRANYSLGGSGGQKKLFNSERVCWAISVFRYVYTAEETEKVSAPCLFACVAFLRLEISKSLHLFCVGGRGKYLWAFKRNSLLLNLEMCS
ncbi:hypothetical protein CEXT_536971 [Caerostris extrusa]|uniref:Uncharacterized protein n=1 Tax=Caerostris extrusa TaxID=172846 RepID=A0AAV4P5D2_CAEEX|nr:hypothetical protein CEXT_536971 [Caerostris extrusa]